MSLIPGVQVLENVACLQTYIKRLKKSTNYLKCIYHLRGCSLVQLSLENKIHSRLNNVIWSICLWDIALQSWRKWPIFGTLAEISAHSKSLVTNLMWRQVTSEYVCNGTRWNAERWYDVTSGSLQASRASRKFFKIANFERPYLISI